MQNNYYFLNHLSTKLGECIINKLIIQCFSQNKNELVIKFSNNFEEESSFYIQASLDPSFTCLSFPHEFKRANSNSVDLFGVIIGKKVVSIKQHLNERAFSILLASDYRLTFKLFGNKANILLFKENGVNQMFQNNILGDKNLLFYNLDRSLDVSFKAFEVNKFNLQKTIPTLGNFLVDYLKADYLNTYNSSNFDSVHFWEFVNNSIINFSKPNFYISNVNTIPKLSIVTDDLNAEKFTDSILALNRFFYLFSKTNGILLEKNKATIEINSHINKLKISLLEINKRLSSYESGIKNLEIANILMANIHLISPKSEICELFDFYRNTNITIKLKKDLSPQKNAENYYRKSKNESIEINLLKKSIAEKEIKLINYDSLLTKLNEIDDIKEFRKCFNNADLIKTKKDNNDLEPSFKIVQFEGFQIYIGKSATNNDMLTQKFAKKDDLWLHARDVSGSHVVVPQQSGKKIPKNVIERAAQLAAFYSKRRNDTVCSVIVTQKKYVRKPKNFAAGKVLVDKEEILLVQPML